VNEKEGVIKVFLFLLKDLKLSNRGSLLIPSPLAFAEGLLYFKILYEKRRIFE